MRVVILTLVLIAVPLYLSYDDIVERLVMEKYWQNERFLDKWKIYHRAASTFSAAPG